MTNWRLRWIWILILPVVLLVRHFFIQDPQLAESLYGQFIFPSLRFIFDFSVGLIPLTYLSFIPSFLAGNYSKPSSESPPAKMVLVKANYLHYFGHSGVL